MINAPSSQTSGKEAVVSAPANPPLTGSQPSPVTTDSRYNLIAKAAYLRAEARRFAPGHEEEDWREAEIAIDRILAAQGGLPHRAD